MFNWQNILSIQLTILLIVMFFFTLIIFFTSKKNPLAYQFTSLKGKAIGAVSVLSLIFLAAYLSFWALREFKEDVDRDVNIFLHSLLQTTQQALMIWVKDQKNQLKNIANDPRVVELAQMQIDRYQNHFPLNPNDDLDNLRAIFRKIQPQSSHIGFFVVTPTGINVASLRNINIGMKNPIYVQKPDLFKRTLNNEIVLIPPISSDIPLGESKNIAGKSLPPTMFFAAPLVNGEGKVFAVLTERFNPHEDFSQIANLSRIGKTGETLTLDLHCNLLTESRFTDTLRKIGEIANNEQSILSISDCLLGKDEITDQPDIISDTKIVEHLDYRGHNTLSLTMWSQDLEIAIRSKIDKYEAYSGYQKSRYITVIVLTLTVLMAIFLTAFTLFLGNQANLVLTKDRNNLEEEVEKRTKELKEAKEYAEQSNQKREFIQYAIDHAMDMAFWFTVENGHLYYINSTAAKMIGYDLAEIHKLRIFDLKLGIISENWHDCIDQLREDNSLLLETTLCTKNKEQRTYSC